jgi:prophage antirepressor-like protein
MNSIQPFTFDGSEVRTLLIDEDVWFVANDICCVLGLSHITKALSGLDEDELTVQKVQSGGQYREMKLISESGLYTLIIRSNKPQAKPFRRWVTHEVLPTIRKTGSYTMSNQEKLCPDKLNEIGFASRSALLVAKSMGIHSKVKKQKLVSDLVEEATGYNLRARLQDSGLIEIPVTTAVEDSIQSFVDHALEERNQSQTIQIVYEGFVYYWKEVLGLTKRLRQLGYELDKRGGVLKLVGYALSYDFKSEMAEV